MFFSEKEKVKCLTKTNIERDIIAISIRLLWGKQINEKNETIQTIKEVILSFSLKVLTF
jgi:arabinogalactan endo-1,4-beta-galactosidase